MPIPTEPLSTLTGRVLLAGAGNMGRAMLAGWLAAGLPPSRIVVQEPSPSADVVALCAAHGIALLDDVPSAGAVEPPAVIVVAVKPQVMAEVFPRIAAHAGPQTVTVSIAAGRSLASLEAMLPAGAAVIRAMPNTPAAIGRGITGLVGNRHVRPDQRAHAVALLSAVGEVVEVPDEAAIDAVTAVSGSGPAYVFLLVEALAEAGAAAGLAPDVSMRLARQTVVGAGALLEAAPSTPPATLRTNVTSPGGTTAAALAVLMADDGLQALMTRAVASATARARALAG